MNKKGKNVVISGLLGGVALYIRESRFPIAFILIFNHLYYYNPVSKYHKKYIAK